MKCVKCGRRAAFICPIGTMCPTDALLAAAFHDWIPAHIRPEDRLERLPAEYLTRFRNHRDRPESAQPVAETRPQQGRPSPAR